MSKRITIALAGVALAAIIGGAVGAGWFEDEAAGSGMPVPGFEIDDTVVGDSEMPVPGLEGVDEQIVGDSAGMPVPGFEGIVADTEVHEGD